MPNRKSNRKPTLWPAGALTTYTTRINTVLQDICNICVRTYKRLLVEGFTFTYVLYDLQSLKSSSLRFNDPVHILVYKLVEAEIVW
jgi:hypothetical protein